MAEIERLIKITVERRLITEECPTCGIVFAWPEDFHRNVRLSGGQMRAYCPSGHTISWGSSEADQLRSQLNAERIARQRAEQRIAEKEDEARVAWNTATRERNRANGYKGHATRITKRAKAGICPCCNRHFVQLERHMATKHPQFTPECPNPPRLEVVSGGKS